MDTSTGGGHAAAKIRLRYDVLARRAQRRRTDPGARIADGAAVAELLAGTSEIAALRLGDTVAAYLELPTELPVAATRSALHERGVQILVPVLLPDSDLDWARWTPGGGVGEAVGREAIVTAAAVLVPGVAGDAAGGRLGRGGGSYDRALHRLREPRAGARPWTCLVLFADEIVGTVPQDPHDARVDALVTPSGLLRVGRSSSG